MASRHITFAWHLQRQSGIAGGTCDAVLIVMGSGVAHLISLFLLLFAFWLLNSGHYTPLVVGLGALSCAFIVATTRRMEQLERARPEGGKIVLSLAILLYWPWLAWQIVKANLQVARFILNPKCPISPRMVRVETSQKGALGRVIYANSITLTPGTVSVRLDEDTILVHALDESFARELEEGEMNRRVAKLETGR